MPRLDHDSKGPATTYRDDVRVVLLRALNVSGHNCVAMEDLRQLAIGLGCCDVRSLLQTGNLVCRCPRRTDDQMERSLEAAAVKSLGLRTDAFVRTRGEWDAVIAANPFPKEARHDPARLVLVALKGAPSAEHVDSLRAAIKGREVAEVVGRQAYFVYPDGMGRSRLTNAVIEKHLGTRGTARNWNTVLKLAILAAGKDAND